MTKKIAIVCGSPSSEFLAPFDDKSWDIWVLGNRINRFLEKDLRVSAIFEIHDDLREHGNIEAYANYLVGLNIPMIVGDKFPIIDEHVKRFPYDKAKELYGQTYLTSSSAYMMAMAILLGAEEIAIYGVDMAVDDHEYFWQRPCMEAWIGFAKGKGIKVSIPEISSIGKCNYVEGKGRGGKPDFAKPPFTEKEFTNFANKHQELIANMESQIISLQNKIQAHSGCVQTYQRLAQVSRAVEAGINIDSLSQTNKIRGLDEV